MLKVLLRVLRLAAALSVVLLWMIPWAGCSDDCDGCPELIRLVCTCYGESSEECTAARDASEKACRDNPQQIDEICRTAVEEFECE